MVSYLGTIIWAIYTILTCMHAQRVSGRGLEGVSDGAYVEIQA